jgi:DNA-binding GntR family transcriptional regulator
MVASALATVKAPGDVRPSRHRRIASCRRFRKRSTAIAGSRDGLFHQTIDLIDICDAINAVRRGVTERQHRSILAALRARDAQRAGLEMKNHPVDVRRSLIGS